MTVAELMNLLQEMIDEGVSEDAEVRMVTQPSYPLQATIHGAARSSEMFETDEIDEDGDPDDVALCAAENERLREKHTGDNEIVYLTEGHSPHDTPYASRVAWEVARRV